MNSSLIRDKIKEAEGERAFWHKEVQRLNKELEYELKRGENEFFIVLAQPHNKNEYNSWKDVMLLRPEDTKKFSTITDAKAYIANACANTWHHTILRVTVDGNITVADYVKGSVY